MTSLHPNAVCADIIKKYTYREDALNYMLQMQNSLQEFVASKRGTKAPKSEMTDFERSQEAIYFWGCATTEWYELVDAIEIYRDKKVDNKNQNEINNAKHEMQFEYIDIWHFMMNVFLYTGIDETEIVFSDFCSAQLKNIEEYWAELTYWIGRYINALPFKRWKTYKDYKISDEELALCFENALAVFFNIGHVLGIDKEQFFNLYCSKNEENIKRQEETAKGYV